MQPIVTYDGMIARFPNIKPKSAELAKKLLPIYPSPELASVVAALMTDGHIDWYTGDGRPRTRKIILYSSKKCECEWFVSLCNKLFGTSGKTIAYNPKSGFYKMQPYKAVINNAAVAMMLILSGVPAGNKTNSVYMIPKWIMAGNAEIKAAFLKFFFNFEGSSPERKQNRPCSWQISLFMSKLAAHKDNAESFLNQIKSLLNEFGVTSSRTCQRKQVGSMGRNIVSYFTITNQASVVNFHRHIGFYSAEKQRKLESAILKIARNGRIRSPYASNILAEAKKKIGTDKDILAEVNRVASCKYTCRQIEHFRRAESKMPYDLLFALVKINKNKEMLDALPPHVPALFKFNALSSRQ